MDVIRGYWAQAYCNESIIGVVTYSGYRGGTDFDWKGPRHALSASSTDEVVGLAVQDSLAHSRFVLPAARPGSTYPPGVEFDAELYEAKLAQERYTGWVSEMMESQGCQSKHALFTDMKMCTIARRSGVITIKPSRHKKLDEWTGNGINQEDYVVIPDDASPAQLGKALRIAFSRCKA